MHKITEDLDFARRFGGVERLYTPEGAKSIQAHSFVVVGLGGVGSWVAEALVRTSAMNLTLIDLDNVAESNTNRQIQALNNNYGKPKTQALTERFLQINPLCKVTQIEDFIDEENVEKLLPSAAVVIDCIDNAKVKAAMIACCVKRKQTIITCGGAGGRKNPLRITSGDLALTRGDPLLSRVRSILRKNYGFPKIGSSGKAKKFGVTSVYSDEPMQSPSQCCAAQTQHGLACAGYGSSVVVTASMGLAAVSVALGTIL